MSREPAKVSLMTACVFVSAWLSHSAMGQPRSGQSGPTVSPADAAAMSFNYRFENRRFHISLIKINLEGGSSGLLQFKRGESDDLLDRRFTLSPRTLARLQQLVRRLNFLESSEDYQSKRDFSHLGWTTITVRQGDLERTVRFNYTTNPEMSEVSDILRGLSTQYIDLFDIELALQHQPLDLPRLIEVLENDLTLERITEPEQLLPTLGEISNDDTIPLIARNHAGRIMTKIQKGKFKGAVKSEK